VLGVFPEGGIERPAGTLRPFFPGVGLIIARSGAPVLPVWISGTPRTDTAWDSLLRTSRTRVVFGPLIRPVGRDSEDIARQVRAWFKQVSGWPDTE
jgi:1-acyl-sn-glycerol-3-phosphate acyltransferase